MNVTEFQEGEVEYVDVPYNWDDYENVGWNVPDYKDEITHSVWFDITIDGEETLERVVFGLFGKTVPKTVENFRALTTGEKGNGKSGKPLHYKGTQIFKVRVDYMIQGGDTEFNDGRGGESIYGETFEDEYLGFEFDRKFLLAMENDGPNTNNSKFTITLASP